MYGGAGVILTCSDPADPTVTLQNHRMAEFIKSFVEDAAAMQIALELTTANHPDHSRTISTDSQSLLKAIERQSLVTHHLRSLLNVRPGLPTLLWISGHKGIPGYVHADIEFKIAATNISDPPKTHLLRIRKTPYP